MKKLILSVALLCGVSFASVAADMPTTLGTATKNQVTIEGLIEDMDTQLSSVYLPIEEELQTDTPIVCGHQCVVCFYTIEEYNMCIDYLFNCYCG